MRNVLRTIVTFECISGGHGWGKTGATVQLGFKEPLTDVEYLRHAPGGWVIKSKEEKYFDY